MAHMSRPGKMGQAPSLWFYTAVLAQFGLQCIGQTRLPLSERAQECFDAGRSTSNMSTCCGNALSCGHRHLASVFAPLGSYYTVAERNASMTCQDLRQLCLEPPGVNSPGYDCAFVGPVCEIVKWRSPTQSPSTSDPTQSPSTSDPTLSPTVAPTVTLTRPFDRFGTRPNPTGSAGNAVASGADDDELSTDSIADLVSIVAFLALIATFCWLYACRWRNGCCKNGCCRRAPTSAAPSSRALAGFERPPEVLNPMFHQQMPVLAGSMSSTGPGAVRATLTKGPAGFGCTVKSAADGSPGTWITRVAAGGPSEAGLSASGLNVAQGLRIKAINGVDLLMMTKNRVVTEMKKANVLSVEVVIDLAGFHSLRCAAPPAQARAPAPIEDDFELMEV